MNRRNLLLASLAAPFAFLAGKSKAEASQETGVKLIREYRLCSDTIVREYEWPDSIPIAFDYSIDGSDLTYQIQAPAYNRISCDHLSVEDRIWHTRESFGKQNKDIDIKDVIVCYCRIREDPDIVAFIAIQRVENLKPVYWSHMDNSDRWLNRSNARKNGYSPKLARYTHR